MRQLTACANGYGEEIQQIQTYIVEEGTRDDSGPTHLVFVLLQVIDFRFLALQNRGQGSDSRISGVVTKLARNESFDTGSKCSIHQLLLVRRAGSSNNVDYSILALESRDKRFMAVVGPDNSRASREDTGGRIPRKNGDVECSRGKECLENMCPQVSSSLESLSTKFPCKRLQALRYHLQGASNCLLQLRRHS